MRRMIPETELEAQEMADELCKELGPGWVPRVWSNIWWCLAAEKGNISVRYYCYGGYYAYYMPFSPEVGKSSDSALDSVSNLRDRCESELSRHTKTLTKVIMEVNSVLDR